MWPECWCQFPKLPLNLFSSFSWTDYCVTSQGEPSLHIASGEQDCVTTTIRDEQFNFFARGLLRFSWPFRLVGNKHLDTLPYYWYETSTVASHYLLQKKKWKVWKIVRSTSSLILGTSLVVFLVLQLYESTRKHWKNLVSKVSQLLNWYRISV